jgi:hypothetical protein
MERLLKDRSGQLPPSSRAGLKLSVVSIYASMPPDQQMKVTLNFNFLDLALVQSLVPKSCMLLDRCLSQRLRGTERLSWQQILRKHRSQLAVYGTYAREEVAVLKLIYELMPCDGLWALTYCRCHNLLTGQVCDRPWCCQSPGVQRKIWRGISLGYTCISSTGQTEVWPSRSVVLAPGGGPVGRTRRHIRLCHPSHYPVNSASRSRGPRKSIPPFHGAYL